MCHVQSPSTSDGIDGHDGQQDDEQDEERIHHPTSTSTLPDVTADVVPEPSTDATALERDTLDVDAPLLTARTM
jgi:hypothetical protein